MLVLTVSQELAVGAVVILAALWLIPELQLRMWSKQIDWEKRIEPKDYLALKNSYRTTIVQVLGGVILIAGLVYTGRQITNTENTLRLTERGQITDRFSRAIDQLGSDKQEVRIGSIYALDKIVTDYDDYYPANYGCIECIYKDTRL